MKGKYDDPLRGEKPLKKLTRYIQRNMPDDDPGRLTADKASAVAKYIYEAFYSREARGEKPPRIELVRLTNRQYLNSVADILKSFTGPDTERDERTGLRATCFNSQHFNGEKKLFERIDETIDFDFGGKRPDGNEAGTNGFSIEWKGSVLAEQTGDYEFLLKTPNGARLWVNDLEEPLIDAWVASGQDAEHHGKIRLLGGRAYPLKLMFFKAAEKSAAVSLLWIPPHGARQVIQARSFWPKHSSPTFALTTAFPADDSSQGYERGVSISKAWDEATTAAAIETAKYVSDNLDRLAGVARGESNRTQKIQAFCERFVSLAFHRPLSADDKRLYIELPLRPTKHAATGKQSAPNASTGTEQHQLEDGVCRVVMLALKSPRFLYPGLSAGKSDAYEIAARLSYALWDSIPGPDWMSAAEKGELNTDQQIRAAASRMLADPRAHSKMLGFFHHWLQVDRIETLSKDSKLFPQFTPELVSDLRASLDLFLEDTMWTGDSDYRKLLQADYLFCNERLAQFYGLSTNEWNASTNVDAVHGGFRKISFPGQNRCGVLTHPYLLASLSYQKLSSPIHRGVFLTRHIVGRSLRPPPMAMTFKDADFSPGMTMRQKVSALTKPQACQTCHSVINPLGFSLEQFDAVGRFRTTENDKPIETTGEYISDDGETIKLSSARDVAEFALGSEQAHITFIQELFHHVVKQSAEAFGPETIERLHDGFVKSGFNMQKLLVEIAVLEARR